MSKKSTRESSFDAGIMIKPLCYVLECQPSVTGGRPNYYVGISLCSLHSRLSQHWAGRGSKWSRLHPPVRIHSVRWQLLEEGQPECVLSRVQEIKKGLLPNDPKWVGKIISDICYHNAREYFEY